MSKVVSTNKLAPAHKSEKPIRSQVSKLTQLLTWLQLTSFHFSPLHQHPPLPSGHQPTKTGQETSNLSNDNGIISISTSRELYMLRIKQKFESCFWICHCLHFSTVNDKPVLFQYPVQFSLHRQILCPCNSFFNVYSFTMVISKSLGLWRRFCTLKLSG